MIIFLTIPLAIKYAIATAVSGTLATYATKKAINKLENALSKKNGN